MKFQLGPVWTREEQAAGDRLRRAWEAHSEAHQGGADAPRSALGLDEEHARAENVRARHERALLQKANVVAVAVGVRSQGGTPTGQTCIVAYVEKKLPADQLGHDDLVPSEIEGVPVDVVEVGEVKAL